MKSTELSFGGAAGAGLSANFLSVEHSWALPEQGILEQSMLQSPPGQTLRESSGRLLVHFSPMSTTGFICSHFSSQEQQNSGFL